MGVDDRLQTMKAVGVLEVEVAAQHITIHLLWFVLFSFPFHTYYIFFWNCAQLFFLSSVLCLCPLVSGPFSCPLLMLMETLKQHYVTSKSTGHHRHCRQYAFVCFDTCVINDSGKSRRTDSTSLLK